MNNRRLGTAILAIVCLGLTGQPSQARPPHKKALVDYLGTGPAGKLNDCRTCHLAALEGADDLESRPHNAFGKRLKAVRSALMKAGKSAGIPARVEAVADEDSDGDGYSNLLELVTGHFPGEANDHPATKELAQGREAITALLRHPERVRLEPFRARHSSRKSRHPFSCLGPQSDRCLHRRRARIKGAGASPAGGPAGALAPTVP